MISIRVSVMLSLTLAIVGFELNAQSDTAKYLGVKIAPYNYVASWYSGNGAQMEMVLHDALVKRRVVSDTKVESVSYSWMIDAVDSCVGCITKSKEGRIDVTILDETDSLASAKVLSNDFFDYLHLVKLNGNWKVFNVVCDYYNCKSVDSVALNNVIEEYLEYWYAGVDEQMAELIHPKYSGGMVVSQNETYRVDKSQLLSIISNRPALNMCSDFNFKILDIYLNTASVKIYTNDSIEYLHLSYQNNKWYIINALRNFDFNSQNNFNP